MRDMYFSLDGTRVMIMGYKGSFEGNAILFDLATRAKISERVGLFPELALDKTYSPFMYMVTPNRLDLMGAEVSF